MSQITYRQVGDYRIPNITLSAEEKNATLGKYGLMRKNYLMNHRKVKFNTLLMTGELMKHLLQTEQEAQQMLEQITEQMMKSEGVTETLKETDQMRWVQMMNNIRASAEETVLKELIYS
ncbi:MAG: TnpV protein [Clostridia bacterium]|nr:TnpV protein [Clostridia bacterium]MBR4049830.1 TnpV protein [Clostridia bacterium]